MRKCPVLSAKPLACQDRWWIRASGTWPSSWGHPVDGCLSSRRLDGVAEMEGPFGYRQLTFWEGELQTWKQQSFLTSSLFRVGSSASPVGRHMLAPSLHDTTCGQNGGFSWIFHCYLRLVVLPSNFRQTQFAHLNGEVVKLLESRRNRGFAGFFPWKIWFYLARKPNLTLSLRRNVFTWKYQKLNRACLTGLALCPAPCWMKSVNLLIPLI